MLAKFYMAQVDPEDTVFQDEGLDGLDEGRLAAGIRAVKVDDNVYSLETPKERVGEKRPRELLAPKSLGFPQDITDVERSAGAFVAEQYLGDEFSDEEFTDHLIYELDRRKRKFEEAPDEGLRNWYESCKAQKDDVSRVVGWGLGVGVGGSIINYLKAGLGPGIELSATAGVVYGGYGFSTYGLFKGFADMVTVKERVSEFSDEFQEQSELYHEAYLKIAEEGHDLDRIDVSHNPVLDSEKSGKYRKNGENWEYDGPETLYDRLENLFARD